MSTPIFAVGDRVRYARHFLVQAFGKEDHAWSVFHGTVVRIRGDRHTTCAVVKWDEGEKEAIPVHVLSRSRPLSESHPSYVFCMVGRKPSREGQPEAPYESTIVCETWSFGKNDVNSATFIDVPLHTATATVMPKPT
jgi:hypothetical protein